MIVATDGEDEGFVYAFEQVSGDVRWKHHIGRPAPSDVVRHGELIYVNTRGDSLVALELATGKVRWHLGPSDGPRFGGFVSSPIIVGEHVVLAGRDGVVYSLDVDDGQVVWHHQVGAAMTSPVVAGDLVYVGIDSDNHVIALSTTTGLQVAETRSTESLVSYMHPVATGQGLCIVTGATLEFWTADLGQLHWQDRAPARLGRSPVAWNEQLVMGTTGGHLVRYRVTDGQPTPIVQLKGVVTGLTGYGEELYVGTQEGTLYALRP